MTQLPLLVYRRSAPSDVHNMSSSSVLIVPMADHMLPAAYYKQPSNNWNDMTLSLSALDQSPAMWPFTQLISFVVRSRYEADRTDLVAANKVSTYIYYHPRICTKDC